jgi:nitrite reductase (NO-forming)
MRFPFENPIWTGVAFVATLSVALWFGQNRPAYAGLPSGQRPSLVLTPKAQLQNEEGHWSVAPNVASPITRKEQRRVTVNWTIKEGQAEIAPGVIYDNYWGFEGKVPGPLLRVREGDLVEIHLTNGLDSKNAHNIDFHFVSGPGGGASALNVMPGQTAVLEARALAPGLFMFHCASPDIPSHIANGMYGFVLVEPAEGMRPVDKEFYVVQSEIYAHNGDKGHQSFDVERGERSDPQYVVFNGAVGSLLKDKALHAPLGKSVRLYVGNAGPNFISSFHVIGQIFDNVYREGDLISPPAHGLQTTLIPAGGSSVVEFTPQVPGSFLLVDHAIFRLHRGAVGSVVVDGDQKLAAEIYNPITAAGQVEMSADAHLGHGMSEAGPAQGHEEHEHADRAAVEEPEHQHGSPVVKQGSLAEDHSHKKEDHSQKNAHPELVLNNNAPLVLPATTTAGATVAILPGAGNYNSPNTYGPQTLTVKRGTTIAWTNKDQGMVHDVASDDGGFISGLLMPGKAWFYTFTKPGIYKYHCQPHPWMKGTIIVK